MYQSQLDNIRVAAPCAADWSKMYGNDRVRFCGQCQLYVYNLSALTREQAEALIIQNEGKLCSRCYRRADGTLLTQNCPKGLAALKERFHRMGAGIASGLLTFFGSLGLLWFVKPAPVLHEMGSIPVTGLIVDPAPPPPVL